MFMNLDHLQNLRLENNNKQKLTYIFVPLYLLLTFIHKTDLISF